MTVLKVLTYPNNRLRLTAKQVNSYDDELRVLIEDMYDTMYQEGGVGLAATQVGVTKRLFVMDVQPEQGEPKVYINPSFQPSANASGDIDTMGYEEGCLSVPDFRYEVTRYAKIDVTYNDIDGKLQQETFDQLAAVCFQHELDHLNGKLFIDHLSPKLKREFRKKLKQSLHAQTDVTLSS